MIFENYMSVLKKYAKFEGRSRRQEYWFFFLANIIVSIILTALTYIPAIGGLFSMLSYVCSLALMVPGLAVCVRRLHDIDKKWTWLFIGLIPLVGGIWLIVLLAKEGTKGVNQFGEDPKQL